jgi:hypothetical protein
MAQNSSDNSNRDERTNRFRTINSTPQEEEDLPPRSVPASSSDGQSGAASRTPAQPSGSVNPLDRLRRTQQMKAVEEIAPPPVERPKPGIASSFKSFRINRKAKPQEAKPMDESMAGEVEPAPPSRKMRLAPAFWTIASTLSLLVNLILIIVLLFLLNYVSKLNLQVNELLSYASLPEDTVKGLYENFVLMDNAHIRTEIPVSINVPVQFDLTINTQTEVTLSQDTPINQARVTLSTGGLNINNAPANIILPAGTRLPINLSLVVPVDKTVPVSLIVPIDIALRDTDLHTPFLGLQQVIQPLYCLLDPQATSNAGLLLCPPPSSP